MPDPHGIKGRVTIRLILNERGNIASVRLVQSGGNSELDQEIVFAAQQTSFPFPPKNASEADRTFLVTYVYK
jgi:periplasmic protein TonB